ncbi:nuclear transport factor 2 family protein [Pseudonocardia kunmingensis]|uniref:SnoaL-like protein n=1 Tax=Pseudonocardia kunmingensis TaxID=630975 RepID=A0A543DWE9_9PSEU|nr:nuclear transport factor 2 family protein [Pseudonocardia kunmingensis]TQM13644.1 hypothetical protein FB558_0397 [Pseudonocardia kunmingensis]
MTAPSVLDVWRSGRTDRLAGLVADDVVFSSPAADYRGRDAACHVLGLVARVLEQVERTAEWGSGDETVAAFTARVADGQLHGMLRERRDHAGALLHVTLFLRPYRTLRVAIGRMRELLEDEPLPTGRS